MMEKELKLLLSDLQPALHDGEYLFLQFAAARYGFGAELNPIASFVEDEGLTLVVPRSSDRAESSHGSFRRITLHIHSSLMAVGLTAAVANALAHYGISANILAAYFHDHIFVPASRAEQALEVLKDLSRQAKCASGNQ